MAQGKRKPRNWLDMNFKLLEAAAVAGERCPQSYPHGPIDSGAVAALVEAKRIRSEVCGKNYRVVTILTGPHKGRSTAPHPGASTVFVWGSEAPEYAIIYGL
jgi:hypothetical protein